MRKITFYKAMFLHGDRSQEACEGYAFEVRGHHLVAHRAYDEWGCTDLRTGFSVSVGRRPKRTRKELIASVESRFSDDEQFARLQHASSAEPQINELPNPA